MHIVAVSIRVKDDRIDDFLAATLRNVQETLKEPGVRRFDLLQENAAPNQFLLVEVCRQAADHARHKDTENYRRWTKEVEPFLVAPRSRTVYGSCFPRESGWE